MNFEDLVTKNDLKPIKDQIKAMIDKIDDMLITLGTTGLKPNETMRAQEAADYLGISLPTFNKYLKAGVIEGYRVSPDSRRRIERRFKKADLDKAMEELKK
jgi:excisionase family DNA binding protein